jgi:O-antigen biosynthesis protein
MQPIEAALREKGSTVLRGGDFDRWDLEVRGGLLGCVRMLIAVEEHGGGKQLARFRSWPRPSPVPIFLTVLLGALAIAGGIDHAWVAFASLAALDTFLITRIVQECSLAMGAVLYVLETPKRHKVENVSPVARELV